MVNTAKQMELSSTMAYNKTFISIKDYKTESVIPRNSSCLILLLQIANGCLAERKENAVSMLPPTDPGGQVIWDTAGLPRILIGEKKKKN